MDLVIRSGLNFPVSREAKWRPLSEKTVAAFASALNRSPLKDAMASIALEGAPNGGSSNFSQEGLNRSRTVTLKWWCAPGGSWPDGKPRPVEATVRLEMPGSYGRVNQNLHVEIDVLVRRSVLVEIMREQSTNGQQITVPLWRITAQQLSKLLDGMLATLSNKKITGPLAEWPASTPSPYRSPVSCTW